MPQLGCAVILGGLALVLFISIFLIMGGILIWPIINVVAYLKVLIFPKAIRVKYGSSLEALSEESFKEEITDDDRKEVEDIKTSIKRLADNIRQLHIEFEELGPLNKNKDGSISLRSKKGKRGQELENELRYLKEEMDDKIAAEQRILEKPWDAWSDWKSRYGRYLGNRDSIIFMILGFPIFFFILSQFNLIEVNFIPSFTDTVAMYTYIVFVGPVIEFFDVNSFKDGFSSLFISYDYALQLRGVYDEFYTAYNWAIMTLPMPLLTLLVYFGSRAFHLAEAETVMPPLNSG